MTSAHPVPTTAIPEDASDTVRLACELIGRESVTPTDGGCQALLAARLERLGFQIENLPFGEVDNLWAVRGDHGPYFVFAGHTDVVPTGPLDQWSSDPFVPTFIGPRLYGRGAADMKGSLAAMITACETFIAKHPKAKGRIAFLITSDEEGPARDGTVRVMETLRTRGVYLDWCVVGEPSSTKSVGDVVRRGRRGSLNGTLRVHGVQGHVAYAELARNPIHAAFGALKEMTEYDWDCAAGLGPVEDPIANEGVAGGQNGARSQLGGNAEFPPTSFQISNINAGTGATNVIPGSLEAAFNFRYSTKVTHRDLMSAVESMLTRHGVDFALEWHHSGRPFYTGPGALADAVTASINRHAGLSPELSTSGGTSDGRFIAPTGTEVMELGPTNATIHQIDEHIEYRELDVLAEIYDGILVELLAS